MRLALIVTAASLALTGCGTTALNNLTQNQACTTRVTGKLAFGSITPTGTLNVSAVCKPSEASPAASSVPAPSATDALGNTVTTVDAPH